MVAAAAAKDAPMDAAKLCASMCLSTSCLVHGVQLMTHCLRNHAAAAAAAATGAAAPDLNQ